MLMGGINMQEKEKTETKKVFIMRHGYIDGGDEYEKLSYEDFMLHLLKSLNPKLINSINYIDAILIKLSKFIPFFKGNFDSGEYKICFIPQDIDVIFHSPSCRAIQTAKFIRKKLYNQPRIDSSLKQYLAEIKFSENILNKDEFERNNGWKGCRQIVLKRWFKGENKESFLDSYERLKKLDEYIKKCPYKNILLVTHGMYLRLIYLFYLQQLNIDENGNLIRDEETLEKLLRAPRLKCGGMLEYEFNGKSSLIKSHSEQNKVDVVFKNGFNIRNNKFEKLLGRIYDSIK